MLHKTPTLRKYRWRLKSNLQPNAKITAGYAFPRKYWNDKLKYNRYFVEQLPYISLDPGEMSKMFFVKFILIKPNVAKGNLMFFPSFYAQSLVDKTRLQIA